MGSLFRPFTAAKDLRTVRAKLRLRREVATVKRRTLELRAKIKARQPLTDADHRLLAKMGPHTLRAIGYVPRVTL